MATAQPLSAHDSDTASLVTDRARIGHLLMRVMDTRAPLAVALADRAQVYTSLIIEANLAAGFLLLDELHPPEGASAVEPGTLLQLRTRVEGSPLDFICVVEGLLYSGSSMAYRVKVPTKLHYHERRGTFRGAIPSDMALPPITCTGADGTFRGRLVDVSQQGVGTVIPSYADAGVGRIYTCTVSLPGTRLIADVQVRSVIPGKGSQRLGLKFESLASAQKTAIERAVAALDRDSLRRFASARWL